MTPSIRPPSSDAGTHPDASANAKPQPLGRRPWALAATTTLVAVLGSLSLLSGCSEGVQAQGGPPGAPPVAVAPAVERMVREQLDFTGRLEAPESVDIRARVGGPIDKVHFRDGAVVKAGQLLFTIDRRTYAAEVARFESQQAAAQAQLAIAQADLGRAQGLLESRAVSRQEVDQLAAAARTAEAQLRAAEAALQGARLNLAFTEIRAPIAGKLSRAEITTGNLVGPEQVLTTLVSLQKVYAYFDVSEQAFLRLRKVAPATLQARMGLADERGLPHAGAVDFVDNRLNPATGAIRVRAVFDNRDGRFAPGLFARIQLAGGEPRKVVLTPDRAIGTDQSKKFVYVVGADKIAQYREVQPGALREGMRVIEKGLAAGEKVVVSGLRRVRPGAPLEPLELPIDANGLPVEAAPGAAPAAAPASAASAAGA